MPNRYDAWPPSPRSLLCAGVLAILGCSDASHRLGGMDEQPLGSGQRVGSCASGADLEIIDGMEDGDGTIDWTARRGGVWFSFNDERGKQTPASDDETFVMTALDPPRSGSHYAARSQGSGFTKWGAGIGFELFNQQAYDVSNYAGITFWARRAPDTASHLRFAVTDAATAPRGGQCHIYPDYSTCSDYFGANLTLDTAFRRFSLTWSELEQGDWGEPHPPSVDTSAVYGIRFQTGIGAEFDFTIDDIAFLCR